MPFHEMHGRYYSAVAEILREAMDGSLTPAGINRIVQEKAFAESMLTIPEKLKDGSWPLLTGDMRTPLRHAPTMPLTTLQRQWMKALLQDPRIRLFGVTDAGLEDVEALYPEDTFVYFDRYTDGDPYEDPAYVDRFRTILRALHENKRLYIEFTSARGKRQRWNCVPRHLEYSSKDDKFRLITCSSPYRTSINLARMERCELAEPFDPAGLAPIAGEKKRLVLELTDERNALERVMFHFSHLEKQTLQTGEKQYQLTLLYDPEDETEILIRVLSFGPLLKAIEPEDFIARLRERIEKQMKLGAQG